MDKKKIVEIFAANNIRAEEHGRIILREKVAEYADISTEYLSE